MPEVAKATATAVTASGAMNGCSTVRWRWTPASMVSGLGVFTIGAGVIIWIKGIRWRAEPRPVFRWLRRATATMTAIGAIYIAAELIGLPDTGVGLRGVTAVILLLLADFAVTVIAPWRHRNPGKNDADTEE